MQVSKPNLTDEEIQYARRTLGREPSETEWAMLEAQWSEHCSYKSSKPLLKQLPSKGARVLVGPGYDAGVLDIGNGYVVTLHIESHNHPSAIDPYGGAATGVGGILRDILSLGTRPIALLDPLRFGPLNNTHSRWLFDNVVRGISDYGNCVGVPTVGGEVEFDQAFQRNCLVDVACIGLGKKKDLVLAEAKHPGDLVYLIGGSTGRDGIRGASFASKTLTGKSESERSAVQVPDPFTKKLILETILAMVHERIIQGMKDLGGGGLTCGLSEIVAKAGRGIDVDLDKVPIREPDMQPWEIMISESQERMLVIIRPNHEAKLVKILEKYEVTGIPIGYVTDNGLLTVRYRGEIVASAPAKFIVDAPLPNRPAKRPDYLDQLASIPAPSLPRDLNKVLLELLASPNVCSREWIYRQYDHEVGLRTIIRPGDADSAVIRLPNNDSLAVKTDGNSKQCYLDPYWGTINVLSENMSNLVVTGATPIGIVDHLQFGDPGNPEVYWTFKETIRAIRDYLLAVKVPCIGGKVSFYNEDGDTKRPIKPTPVIASIGLRKQHAPKISEEFIEPGDDVIMVGSTLDEMGGSEYYETIHNVTGGKVSRVNLKTEKRLLSTIARIVNSRLTMAIHDVSKGGLATAVAVMAVKGNKGVRVDLDQIPSKTSRIDHLLFTESRSRFIIESQVENTSRLLRLVKTAGIKAVKIGTVDDHTIQLTSGSKPVISIPVSAATETWSQTFPRIMEAVIE